MIALRRLCIAAALLPAAAAAHPLAPALLDLREIAPAQYEVLWRTSVTRAQDVDVAPRFPGDCRAGPVTRAAEGNEALVLRLSLACSAPLAGRAVAVDGLSRSRIAAIARFVPLQGVPRETLLDAAREAWIIPADAVPVVPQYLVLGIEHLATGLDHLLFVAGLVLLVRRAGRLLATLTAFTAGHSVTLALAALQLVRVPQAWMELGIALSVLALAVELARPAHAPPSAIARRPWLMAGAFGLLHGLGFAGALSQVGLPPGDVAAALLGFNLGIELGQIAEVAALLGLGALLHRGIQAPSLRVPAVYLLGTLAAFWCFGRAAVLLA
ncbi:MAG TPA: HupE/UreJ family protein [Candidatus Binatia bacterium]|nr:HupE/UreJ family protein [Candidatus Binatia bacterium]